MQLHQVGGKQLKSALQLLLSSSFLKRDEFLLLFKQHDESSGTAGTWIWSSWGVEAEVSEEH